ncbi:hypothetical protein QN277_000739 [Acacia crassicarpa]|uniref:Auxin-induced protein n=2 Tax=Acacia crassicarpa TaxID=499986 RepID=A0AAE1N757_9FABA|nr:hypothetical protein QN277_000739 [Acacia crassicarpa]
MSVPEKDYVSLSETPTPSMESSEKFSQRRNGLNLKATELRLGLPGSESPERDSDSEEKNEYPLGILKSLVSGAKRGFSDAIDGSSGKWVLYGKGGSDMGLGKDCGLFSPRGANSGKTPVGSDSGKHQAGLGLSAVKDSIPQPTKPLHEKKPQFPAPASKAQVVGWPPIRSFRKNSMASQPQKNGEDAESGKSGGCLYVKVSLDGAPYLRKVDLNNFASYKELSSALEKMFSGFTMSQCGSHGVSGRDNMSESRLMDLLNGSEYVLTYEDKDGDWMLVGDVPWEMFTDSCKRMRIMKSCEAIGLAPRAMEKCKSRN